MPTFFFHFFDGSERVEDDFGVDFLSAEHAYLGAIAAARGMWPELLAEGRSPSRCAFEIVDQRGARVFGVGFAEAMKASDAPPLPTPGTARLIRLLHDTHQRASLARIELTSSLAAVRQSLAESRSLLLRLRAYESPDRRALHLRVRDPSGSF